VTPYREAILAYEAMYRAGKSSGLGKGLGSTVSTHDGPALAEAAAAAGALAVTPYEIAMWRRREWLHLRGRHGDIYDGKDALDWLHAMESRNWDSSAFRAGKDTP